MIEYQIMLQNTWLLVPQDKKMVSWCGMAECDDAPVDETHRLSRISAAWHPIPSIGTK